MKTVNLSLIIIVLSFLCLGCCGKHPLTVSFQNITYLELRVLDGDSDTIPLYSGGLLVKPLSTVYIDCSEEYEWKEEVLRIFVFEQASLNQNTDSATGCKLIKRYDLTGGDLYRLGNKISYPPTEAMKEVKMWPPYGTEVLPNK